MIRPIEDSIPSRDAIKDAEFDRFGVDFNLKRIVRTIDSYNIFGDPKYVISLGLINGIDARRASGFNADITTAVTEIVATQGGATYPYPLVADTLNISSTDLNDTLLGIGANTLRIIGIGSDDKELTEDIALAGLTVVTTVNQFRRINSVNVLTGGVLNENQGVISLTHTISGGLLAEVIKSSTDVGCNRSFSSIQTVPVGKIALITGALASITRQSTGSGVKEGEIQFRVRAPGSVFIPSNVTGLRSDGASSIQVSVDHPVVVPEKSDIEFVGNAFQVGTSFTATYSYLLIDKAIFGLT